MMCRCFLMPVEMHMAMPVMNVFMLVNTSGKRLAKPP